MAISNCRILTWNVRGIMSSAGSLSKLLDEYNIDFAFIAEHKLREQHKSFFDSVHNDYHAFTLCDASVTPGARCGKGGVAIMYKKERQFSVSLVDIQLNGRILGIKIDQQQIRPIYAFSVYMPSVNYSYEEYSECFEYLQNLYETFSELGSVLFLGDFNCDINSTVETDIRLKKFLSFLEITDMSTVPLHGQFTFRPTRKTLDYVIMSRDQHTSILRNVAINQDICTVSDHLPIFTSLIAENITFNVEQNSYVA